MYFTYSLKWSTSNKNYYGVRYKDTATPDSICTTYFTSSKYVKKYILTEGLPDIISIRRIFDDKLSAKRWEEKVIRRLNAIKKEEWLNKGNNNSFKDIVCDDAIKAAISLSRKGQSFGKLYNNGIVNKYFKVGDKILSGWVKGRLISSKQLQHINNLNHNILTPERRKVAGQKSSIKLKGVKKPPQHGANVSKALKGKPRPWSRGENNVSKRADVRLKISESWKNRVIGKWYTNEVSNLYLKPGESLPEGYRRGRKKLKTK